MATRAVLLAVGWLAASCAAAQPAPQAQVAPPAPARAVLPLSALRERPDYLKALEKAERDWLPECDDALKFSTEPENLQKAFVAYRLALKDVPHFGRSLKVLAGMSQKFYRNITRELPEYSGIQRGRLAVGELAGSMMIRTHIPEEDDPLDRDFEPYDSALREANRIKGYEKRLDLLLSLIERAEPFADRVPSQSGLEAWELVLAADPKNWEARYYVEELKAELARQAAEALPKKEPPKPSAWIQPKPERPAARRLRPAPLAIGP